MQEDLIYRVSELEKTVKDLEFQLENEVNDRISLEEKLYELQGYFARILEIIEAIATTVSIDTVKETVD